MTRIIDLLTEKIKYLNSRELEGILFILKENPGLSNNALIQMSGLPKETLRTLKSDMGFILKQSDQNSIYIRDEYLAQLANETVRPFNWTLLNITNSVIENTIIDIRKKYNLLPKREFDQFFATAATTTAKALIVEQKGALDGKNIAVLGDDDLVSAAIKLTSEAFKQLTVFEADKELLSTLNTINASIGTKLVQHVEYNAIKELPVSYKGKFDVVITDPPYTKAGVTLFLNRAVELLATPSEAKYIFLYFGTSFKSPEKTLKIQEIITQMGLLIEDRIDSFAHYNGAEGIGSSSSLYIIRTTPATKPLLMFGDMANLYTYQQGAEDKFPQTKQLTFKLTNVSPTIVASKSAILKSLGQFCSQNKFNVLDERFIKGSKGEWSITFDLNAGHLVAHVWPDQKFVMLEMILFSQNIDIKKLGADINGLFKPKAVQFFDL